MFLDSKYPVYNSIIMFVIIVVILFIFRPSFIYSKKINKFKQFGTKEEETIFTFHITSIGMGILLYFMFSLIERIDKLNND
jgi:heme/copper-type cytochrome/quinol oxidase subunit 2